MSFSSKSKFAGFLRGLIGRAVDRASARPAASAAPASASAPAPRFGAAGPGEAARANNPNDLELPLAPILAAMPIDLRAKLMAVPPPSQTIHLQAEIVVSQLACGAVKITFGELRRLAPGIFANNGGDFDSKLVNVPLQEILPRLNFALLTRRSTKKVEVSDDIIGPFSERGRGFSFTTQPLKVQAAVRQPVAEPEPAAAAPIPFSTPAVVRPVSSAPMAPSVAQRSIMPSAPMPGTSGQAYGHPSTPSMSPSAPTSFTQRSITPGVPGGMGGNAHGGANGGNANGGNGYGNGHDMANGHGNSQSVPPGLRLGPLNGSGPAEAPIFRRTPSPAPAAPAGQPAPQPQLQQPPQPTISVMLGDLCESWPDALRNEILSSPLAQANIPLDGAIILPGLRRGRVVMPWGHIRQLAQPNSGPSQSDNLELELPLKVIAPLFLAAQKAPAQRPRARGTTSDIPDLFFGFPQPAQAPAIPAAPIAPVAPPLASAAPAAPAAPLAQAVPAPVVPPLPKPTTRAEDTNFYVWGENGEAPQNDEAGLKRNEVPQTDFLNRQSHPKDVVMKAVALPGVAGAVVAMADGMRVASQVPVELSADTVAAFLPQIFDRVNQSTRELRMGPLNNVKFTVGNVPWKIFRVNAVYFAAFGRAGEHLPSAQLAQLAADLDRKK